MSNRPRTLTRPAAWTLGLAALLATAATPALAQNIDDRALEVAREAVGKLADADTVQVEMNSEMQVAAPGMQEHVVTVQSFALDRPNNRLALRLVEGDEGETVIVDGENIYRMITMQMGFGGQQDTVQRYTVDPAPENVDELLYDEDLDLLDPMAGAGESLVMLGPVFTREGFEQFVDQLVTQATYEGQEDIDGQAHHHVQFVLGDVLQQMFAQDQAPGFPAPEVPDDAAIRIDLWVSADDDATIRRIVPDLSDMMEVMMGAFGGAFGDENIEVSMEASIDLENWRVNQPIDDDVFAFDPPEGAEEVQDLWHFNGDVEFEEFEGEGFEFQ